MSGVGKETSGVGQHTDEVSKASQVSERGHLLGHAGLVIVEPPCGALLDLTGELLLETADDGSDGSIIIWIQGVQDGLWNLVIGAKGI